MSKPTHCSDSLKARRHLFLSNCATSADTLAPPPPRLLPPPRRGCGRRGGFQKVKARTETRAPRTGGSFNDGYSGIINRKRAAASPWLGGRRAALNQSSLTRPRTQLLRRHPRADILPTRRTGAPPGPSAPGDGSEPVWGRRPASFARTPAVSASCCLPLRPDGEGWHRPP